MSNPIFINTDTNYSLYYNVLNYFRDLMNLHPSIERVTQGDNFGIDDKTFPIYPLGNTFISSLTVNDSYTDYTIQLIVADKIKYGENESEGTDNQQVIPYYGEDDLVDIHANTLGILNDLLNYTGRSVSGFEIIGGIVYTPFADRFDNKLGGFSADFTLRVHNDRNRCVVDFFQNPTTTTTTTAAPTTTTTTTIPPVFYYYVAEASEEIPGGGILTYVDTNLNPVTQSLARSERVFFGALDNTPDITDNGSQLFKSSTEFGTVFSASSDATTYFITNTDNPNYSNSDLVAFYVPKNSTSLSYQWLPATFPTQSVQMCVTYTSSLEVKNHNSYNLSISGSC